MLENINLALQGVWSHKLRSFLTMLGIIIGIAAIITIVSTIRGTNEQIKQNLIGAGNDMVQVQLTQDGSTVDFSYGELPEGIAAITSAMRDEMDALPGVSAVAMYRQRTWADGIYAGNQSFTGTLNGVDDHYLSVAGYQVPSCRRISPPAARWPSSIRRRPRACSPDRTPSAASSRCRANPSPWWAW